MNATAAMADWTLLRIVDEVLKPTGRYAVKTLREYARACRRFDRFCGLELRARDVTVQYLDEFLAWQLSQGYPAKDARKQIQTISTVVRHADDKLLPRWAPRSRGIDGAMNEATAMGNWPLVRVVNEVIKSTGTRSQRTIVKYRQACRRFSRFRGSPQRVSDVTVELVDQFVGWQKNNGYSEGTATDAADHLAAVVRCADRDRLPLKYRRDGVMKSRRPRFEDTDIDASLESIMINEYFPTRSRINDPKTEMQYGNATSKLSRFLGRAPTLKDLDDLTLGRWMRSMKKSGLAAVTINSYMNRLRAFWTWAAKKRLVEMFPTIENLPEPRRTPDGWSEIQMNQLVAACEKMPGVIAGIPAGSWWFALHLVSLDTGERPGAVREFTWDCYSADTGDLESPAEIRKGRKKPMLYSLRPEAMAALEAIRQPERELIFPWPHDIGTFYNRYKVLLNLAGLPYKKGRSGLQKIRRTFASHIEAAGGNATAALDHTSRKVTVESYLDPRIVREKPQNRLLFTVGAKEPRSDVKPAHSETQCDM
jgi:integrase